MKSYETLFVLKPTLTEEESNAKFESVKELITENGGEIVAIENVGTRELAYAINKQARGTYFIIYHNSPSTLIAEVERVFRITEDIIKFMTLKYESKRDKSAFDKIVERAQKLAS